MHTQITDKLAPAMPAFESCRCRITWQLPLRRVDTFRRGDVAITSLAGDITAGIVVHNTLYGNQRYNPRTDRMQSNRKRRTDIEMLLIQRQEEELLPVSFRADHSRAWWTLRPRWVATDAPDGGRVWHVAGSASTLVCWAKIDPSQWQSPSKEEDRPRICTGCTVELHDQARHAMHAYTLPADIESLILDPQEGERVIPEDDHPLGEDAMGDLLPADKAAWLSWTLYQAASKGYLIQEPNPTMRAQAPEPAGFIKPYGQWAGRQRDFWVPTEEGLAWWRERLGAR